MTFSAKLLVGLASGALALASGLASAQAPAPAVPPLVVHTVQAGKIYWVEGGGGNSGIIIGDNGVIVVDAKTTPEAGRALVAEVAKLTPKPITHVIETHSDGDHVNGIAGFPAGLKIIAHVNNKIDQVAVPLFATVEVDGGKCKPPQDRLPNQVIFNDKVSTTLDGEKVIFYHFAPAHTNGDLVVYLPAEKVVFTGDLLTFNVLVHPEKNGSLEGWFKSADGLLALDATTYVGGHATQTDTKDTIRKRVSDLHAKLAQVDALMAQGKSLADIKLAMGDPPKDAPGCRGIPYPTIPWNEYQARTNRDEELK